MQPKGISISSKAAEVASAIVSDLEERFSATAFKLAKLQKEKTLQGRHVQTAVQMLLPIELSQHATAESVKAMNRFQRAAKAVKAAGLHRKRPVL
jgi:hypothetical protein